MLYQYHFKQHNRIHSWSAIVKALQLLDKIIDLIKIHCFVYLPQHMILWYKFFYAYHFQLASFLAFLSPYYIISHFTTKAYLFLLKGRLLRQTEGSTIVEPFLLSATWTISYTQCFYEKCFQIIHIFRTQVVA